MVEVFRTNVEQPEQANLLLGKISQVFAGYKANFDLDDCDRILRVECKEGHVSSASIVVLLKNFGFSAEILPDEIPSAKVDLLIKIENLYLIEK